MQQHIRPQIVLKNSATLSCFLQPLQKALTQITRLESKSNRPLEFGIEDEIKIMVYFHLQNFDSGNDLLQTLEEDTLARTCIAPQGGVPKSTFFEAIGSRGLEQFQQVFSLLAAQASNLIPKAHSNLGKLVVVDPTLIDCTQDMIFADYRDGSHKMQAHIGFDPHCSTPRGIVVTNGKANAREYVETLVHSGETGVFDRGFQCHEDFDRWDAAGLKYVCRIKDNTTKHVLQENPVTPGGYIRSDQIVLLGGSEKTYSHSIVRLVIYRVGSTEYWIATNRFDLTAEQIAEIFHLRWNIEIFFGWWKRFMRVYHLISRTRHGLAVQLLAGLITYLLLAIYCHQQFGEKVSIRRVRQLQHQIHNESICLILIFFILHPLFLFRYAIS